MGAINDLVHLNRTVLLQDVDVVWNRDPVDYLLREINADLAMSYDGRDDEMGPGNSGFLFMRSNCVTKLFAATLWKARSHIPGTQDQIFWNALAKEELFQPMQFEILDERLFVNGHSINLDRGETRADMDPGHFMFHASWAYDGFDKIEKFFNIGHFYYAPEHCAYHDASMIVNLVDREQERLARMHEQEAKFLELGYFKNGTYERPVVPASLSSHIRLTGDTPDIWQHVMPIYFGIFSFIVTVICVIKRQKGKRKQAGPKKKMKQIFNKNKRH